MENFELIDDYLANRLNEQEKISFEQKLEGDPALRGELDLQRQIVEGVRHARTVELKTMLNNVPVGGSLWTGGKIAAGIVSVGVVATILYLSASKDQVPAPTPQPAVEATAPLDTTTTRETTTALTQEAASDNAGVANAEPAAEKEKNTARKEKKSTSPVTKPAIDVVDPSAEFKEAKDSRENNAPSRSGISPSTLEVITATEDKKHDFHYQFAGGKLMLFGPFDKNLYEILEIHGDGHAVFLFYRENYYLLDEAQANITRLVPIKDSLLIRKLKEYRAQ